MAKRKRGHPTIFSPQQNAALREALTVLRARYESQSALGEAIGIEQQNVGRLLNDPGAGFSYATATVVVRLSGFKGVDAFFLKKGVAHSEPSKRPSLPPTGT
jgi:hypothetical protein